MSGSVLLQSFVSETTIRATKSEKIHIEVS